MSGIWLVFNFFFVLNNEFWIAVTKGIQRVWFASVHVQRFDAENSNYVTSHNIMEWYGMLSAIDFTL